MDSQLYQEYKQILKNKSQLLKIVDQCEKLGYFSHNDLETAGKIIVNDKLNEVYKIQDLKEIDTCPSQLMSPKSTKRFVSSKMDAMDYDALMNEKKDKPKIKKNKENHILQNGYKQNKITQGMKFSDNYSMKFEKNESKTRKHDNKNQERKQIQQEERDNQIGQELDSVISLNSQLLQKFFELQDEIKQQERENLKKRETQLLQEQEQILNQQQELENLKKEMAFEYNQKQLKQYNFIDIFPKYKEQCKLILNKIQLARNSVDKDEQEQPYILNQIEPQPSLQKKRKLMKNSQKIIINKQTTQRNYDNSDYIEQQVSDSLKRLDLEELSYSYPDSMFQIDEEVQTNKQSKKTEKSKKQSFSDIMEIEGDEEFESMFQIDPFVQVYKKQNKDKSFQQNDENENPNRQNPIQTLKNRTLDIESENIFYKYIVSQQNNIKLVLGEISL